MLSDAHERPLTGRLAPSPTGAQHIGNARTYLLAWLSVRSRGGRLILRMEDIDSPRIKPATAQQAIDDLRWLGLDWDEGPDVGGPNEPYVQTERVEHFLAALAQLRLLTGVGQDSFEEVGHQVSPLVAARASAFSLRGKTDDLRSIGEKLSVTTVL